MTIFDGNIIYHNPRIFCIEIRGGECDEERKNPWTSVNYICIEDRHYMTVYIYEIETVLYLLLAPPAPIHSPCAQTARQVEYIMIV